MNLPLHLCELALFAFAALVLVLVLVPTSERR
jgi:hypothetical protein